MKLQLYVFTVIIGVVLTVHLAMNGKVGAAINNARVGNAVFWCVGAVMALIIGFSGWESGALQPLTQVNPLLLTAGALGASLVFGIAWLIPQIGAGPLTLIMISGQIAGGLVLSHFGLLGSPVKQMNAVNLVGAAVMVAGVALATR
ncbi:MAG: DMT family transporter [Terriglobia bacterium]